MRREITRRGGQKPCLRIVRELFAALSRSGRGDRAPGRRAGTGRAAAGGLAAHQRRLTETEQRMIGVLDELGLTALVTSITGLSAVGAAAILAETGDPQPVRHRPRAGQARRPGPAGETVRHVHRPDQTHRAGPTRATPGRLARRLGSATRQPRLRRPLPAPDQHARQQAHPHPGPDRDRRGDPAAPARRHHHRPGLGPRHRHPRHPATTAGHARRLSSEPRRIKLTAGASPTRH